MPSTAGFSFLFDVIATYAVFSMKSLLFSELVLAKNGLILNGTKAYHYSKKKVNGKH